MRMATGKLAQVRSLLYAFQQGDGHVFLMLSCLGQDNPSGLCIVGDVPNLFESHLRDHRGPYDGIEMGC